MLFKKRMWPELRRLKMLHCHPYNPFYRLERLCAISGYKKAAKKWAHHHYLTNLLCEVLLEKPKLKGTLNYQFMVYSWCPWCLREQHIVKSVFQMRRFLSKWCGFSNTVSPPYPSVPNVQDSTKCGLKISRKLQKANLEFSAPQQLFT